MSEPLEIKYLSGRRKRFSSKVFESKHRGRRSVIILLTDNYGASKPFLDIGRYFASNYCKTVIPNLFWEFDYTQPLNTGNLNRRDKRFLNVRQKTYAFESHELKEAIGNDLVKLIRYFSSKGYEVNLIGFSTGAGIAHALLSNYDVDVQSLVCFSLPNLILLKSMPIRQLISPSLYYFPRRTYEENQALIDAAFRSVTKTELRFHNSEYNMHARGDINDLDDEFSVSLRRATYFLKRFSSHPDFLKFEPEPFSPNDLRRLWYVLGAIDELDQPSFGDIEKSLHRDLGSLPRSTIQKTLKRIESQIPGVKISTGKAGISIESWGISDIPQLGDTGGI